MFSQNLLLRQRTAVQTALQLWLACIVFHISHATALVVLHETGLLFAVSKEGWGNASA